MFKVLLLKQINFFFFFEGESQTLISKFMTSQTGISIITIHILPNISRAGLGMMRA